MTDLPGSWEWTTLGKVAQLSLGKMLDKKQATGLHPTPYLRNINVRWGSFDLEDVASMDVRPDELDRIQARPGDVVACEGGEPGRAAVWRGPEPIALQKALHRIRLAATADPYFVAYALEWLARSSRLERFFTGTTIKHLPKEKLRVIPVPFPPLADQQRIFSAVDEHLTRLQAAATALTSVSARIRSLERALLSLAQSEGAEQPLDDLLTDIEAGKSFRTPGRAATTGEWGVIKVSAMTWGEFDPTENKAVIDDARIDPKYEIRTGDLLLSRANTSEYVGATVLVGKCPPRLLMSDKSMRLLTRDGVDRAWLQYALASPQLRRQMSALATGTKDSMRNISQAKVRGLRVRVPPPARQADLARDVTAGLHSVTRVRSGVDAAARRCVALRRTILEAAFTGRLA